MKKQLTLLFIVLFCLTAVYGFQKWTIAHLLQEEEITLVQENIAYSCPPPSDFGVKDIEADKTTVYWEDDSGTSWEYIVQSTSAPFPTGAGTPSTVKEFTVTQDHNGNNLLPNTEYELYVRTDCGADGVSVWEGPFNFKTLCGVSNFPFAEGFNTASLTRDCWTIVNANEDRNTWRIMNLMPYEGDGNAYVTGSGVSDDWLISPTLNMTGGIYAISYYYKNLNLGVSLGCGEYEVLLSQGGIDLDKFTTVLLDKHVACTGEYRKETLYIQGITGEVNIAWHFTGVLTLFIDKITIEEINCILPDNIEIKDLKENSVTFSWEDDVSNGWEYHVSDGMVTTPPGGSGDIATTKSVSVNSVTAGTSLQPGSTYTFYVRSMCGANHQFSPWQGPFYFTTPCQPLPLPFWEGFNITTPSSSPTVDCWRIFDENEDGALFQNNSSSVYEGDGIMEFIGSLANGTELVQDDWLVSPVFTLDATRIYRLKYHYKTASSGTTTFDVKLSDRGSAPLDFSQLLLSKEDESSDTWQEETLILDNTGGDISFGWHVRTTTEGNKGWLTHMSLDNVFLEEVVGCPEPFDLKTKNEEDKRATIYWTDNLGSNWEYIVQKEGKSPPTVTGATGTSANTNEVTVTQDKDGDALEPNTAYEFYVRSDCGNGEYSVWMGPYVFQTACQVYDVPFWEGFNLGTNTVNCWTTISNVGKGEGWNLESTGYEGTHSMRAQSGALITDLIPDYWLISPTIRFESGKTYRLKYHYQTWRVLNKYEHEVLLSNSGTDTDQFTHVVVPKRDFGVVDREWKVEYAFISGVSGEINLAWHTNAENGNNLPLYIDNVFVEEVEGCPEPLPTTLGAKDEQSNSVAIFWEDDMGGTQWEYYIQEQGKGVPTGQGTPTTQTENTVTKEQSGKALEPNTDYEFYVRTVCGNGEYSMWAGPFIFVTICDTYTTPFWEGFNSDSKTIRCWTFMDSTGNQTFLNNSGSWSQGSFAFEGDRGLGNSSKESWLVSPAIYLDGGMYVLKFHYRYGYTGGSGETEILLSSKGIDSLAHFDNVLLPGYLHATNNLWKEKTVFFNGITGFANIAWHLYDISGYTYIDNVSIKKVETCPEPYQIEVTNSTPTQIEIEWQQEGSVFEWEVIVVDYGKDETAVPIFTTTVSGTPHAIITGLSEGKVYSVYIRAKCDDDKSYSDWSSPLYTGLKVKNDECSGAIAIPVNSGVECEQIIPVTFFGATMSDILPDCDSGFYGITTDVWFEFTATSESHLLKIMDILPIGGRHATSIRGAVYQADCNTITDAALSCFSFLVPDMDTHSPDRGAALIEDLIPGTKYYIRIFEMRKDISTFNLCLTTPHYVSVGAAGEEYSMEELISDVLIDSECKLAYDIRLQNGDGSAYNQSINTLGYFSKNGSIFPFEEGIVLSTAGVEHVPGPSRGLVRGIRGPYQTYWSGDKDINDLISDVGGGPLNGYNISKQTTQLEFDFIPIQDSIQFEYLFAANAYKNSNPREMYALFGVWLTDLTTEEGGNVALVPNTNYPIANSTIRRVRSDYANDINPEYFWKYYDTGNHADNPLEAPVDFVGLTVPMQSVKAAVMPGRKYRIKFAVINFAVEYSSAAVFFNKASFDLGVVALNTEELGTEDLLIATNTALCPGESAVIRSGAVASDELYMEIEWYKDGVLIPGANEPDLEVNEAGEYAIKVKFPDLECESSDSIVVEIYPPISETVHQAEAIMVCQYALQETVVDLTVVENAMFAAVDRSIYTTSYYNTTADAETTENTIADAANYSLGKEPQAQNLYIRVENAETGCYEVFVLPIQPEEGMVPDQPENVRVCAEYVFPEIAGNQYYYTEPGGAGKAYKAGDILAEPGEHTIYLLQVNSGEGCYEETAYQVNITAPVTADVFEDKTLSCEYYQLAPLSEDNRYYTEPEGQGTELYEGMQILHKQIVYVYASSDDGLCTDESSFVIDYEDCPIPRGISPNNDGLNDVFDLTPHGVESIKIYNRWGTEVYSYGAGYTTQWHGQNKSGKQLPDGTYYYVIWAHGKIRTGWVQINK